MNKLLFLNLTFFRCLLLLGACLGLSNRGLGQNQSVTPTPIRLIVSPKGVDSPRLRYSLFPRGKELKPGNAAVSYHRAILLRREAIGDPAANAETINALIELMDKPPQDVPAKPFRDYVQRNINVYRELETAVTRESCDWDLEQRIDELGISILFPEIQALRDLATVLRIRCRLNILDGKPEAAIEDVRIGFAMARHAGEGPSLIISLVGVAIFAMFENELERIIQMPNAPNLYWSLTALSPRLISIRRAMEGEIRGAEGTLPFWKGLEKGILTTQQAREAIQNFSNISRDATGAQFKDPAEERLLLATVIALRHPSARRTLIDRGYSPERVQQMSAAQAVFLEGKLLYLSVMEELLSWCDQPYPEATIGFAKTETKIRSILEDSNPLDIFSGRLVSLLVPAAERVHQSAGRIDRKKSALRVVEAIRLHASENQGRLPKSLEEIEIVPVPNDPVTGKPFLYRLENNIAYLSANPIDGAAANAGNSLYYQIELKK